MKSRRPRLSLSSIVQIIVSFRVIEESSAPIGAWKWNFPPSRTLWPTDQPTDRRTEWEIGKFHFQWSKEKPNQYWNTLNLLLVILIRPANKNNQNCFILFTYFMKHKKCTYIKSQITLCVLELYVLYDQSIISIKFN